MAGEKKDRNAEIMELRKTMSVDEIATEFSLHRQRIYQIIRFETNPQKYRAEARKRDEKARAAKAAKARAE